MNAKKINNQRQLINFIKDLNLNDSFVSEVNIKFNRDKYLEDAKRKGIVIGYSFIFLFYYRYDHRAANEISSKSFFIITAKVFHQKGFKVYGFKDFVFTPLVVFSSSFFPK